MSNNIIYTLHKGKQS